MSQSWFYQHAGQSHGPVTSEQIKELAKKGLLDAHDLIWPEGGDPQGAIPADAALDFSGVASHPGTVATATASSKPADQPPASAPPPIVPARSPVPDWLSDVAALEKRGPQAPPVSSTRGTEDLEDVRLWFSLGKPAAAADAGFDLASGRIVDPQKLGNWQKRPAGAPAQPKLTNASVLKVFRKARIVIETWVHDEKNRLRVLHAQPAEIKQNRELRAILEKLAAYGPELKRKLEKYLESLIDTHRKQHRAGGKPRS